MDITSALIQELCKDVESSPQSWARIQDWLTKSFPHGRVGLRVFCPWPYTLELDASLQQKGNLDKLTWSQSLRLMKAKQAWVRHKHAFIYQALADHHDHPDVPMPAWAHKRETELTKKATTK